MRSISQTIVTTDDTSQRSRSDLKKAAQRPSVTISGQPGAIHVEPHHPPNLADRIIVPDDQLIATVRLAQQGDLEAFVQMLGDLPTLRDPAAFVGWFRRLVFKFLRSANTAGRLVVPIPASGGRHGSVDDRSPERGGIAAGTCRRPSDHRSATEYPTRDHPALLHGRLSCESRRKPSAPHFANFNQINRTSSGHLFPTGPDV